MSFPSVNIIVNSDSKGIYYYKINFQTFYKTGDQARHSSGGNQKPYQYVIREMG
jgi:hypothetical protein